MSLIKQYFTLNEELQLCTITQLLHEDSNSWTWLGRELTSWNDDNNETYDLDKSVKFNRSLVNMSANWVLTKHPISASIPSEHGHVKITLENTELPLAITELPYITSYILSNELVGNIWYDSNLSIDLVPDNDYKATELVINENSFNPSTLWIYTNESTNKTEDKSFNIYAKFEVDEVLPEEPETPTDLAEPLCFTAEDPGATITLNEGADNISIVTSTDKLNWTPYEIGTTITLPNVGDKVYFRATDGVMNNTVGYSFSTTENKRIAASGNLNTLLKADGSILDLSSYTSDNSDENSGIYCYMGMFQGCTSLTLAPELPAMILAEYCYVDMFRDCIALTKAPELPAKTLANYCYACMFEDCTSLSQAPALPATALAENCYESMFYDCVALTKAPELSATTLVENCCVFMFYNCISLNNINVNFLDWNPTDATKYWVINVSSSGTFTCPTDLPKEFGVNRIPSGWTVKTK